MELTSSALPPCSWTALLLFVTHFGCLLDDSRVSTIFSRLLKTGTTSLPQRTDFVLGCHKKKLAFASPGRMTFAHTMDSSWRRRHASSCSSSKRKMPFVRADSLSWATPLGHDHHDYHLTKGDCTPNASALPHLAPPLSKAAGDAVSSFSSAVDHQRKPWKGSFPLHRVGELSLERVGNSASGIATVGAYSGVFAPAMREVGDVGSTTTLSSSSSRGMGEDGGSKAFDWRDGLGQVARVLALSISSSQK